MKSKEIIEYLLIILAVIIYLPAHGMENNTLSISMSDINRAHYHDGYLFLEFDKIIWFKMRQFTTNELHKKITLIIGDSFVFQPHVVSPLDSRCQLSISESEANNFLKIFNKSHNNQETYSMNDKVDFFESWMKTNPLDIRAFSDEIKLYHEANNVSSCRKAINYYETYPEQSVKDHLLSESYFLLTDCYVKSNLQNKALSFLQSSLKKIHPRDRRRAYEYIGDLYVEIKQQNRAINYYQKALEAIDELKNELKDEYSSMNLKGFDKILDLVKKDKDRIENKIISLKN